LKELKKRGETNGVKRLRIIKKKELFELEPYVNPNATAALLSPDAGNLIPYEYTIALIENAVDNGVELRIRRDVEAITITQDGFEVLVNHWEPATYIETVLRKPNYVALAFAVPAVLGASADVIVAFLQVGVEGMGLRQALLALSGLVIVVGVYMGYWAGRSPNANANLNAETIARASKPVGTGGRKVSIDEMRKGGTGSILTLTLTRARTLARTLARTRTLTLTLTHQVQCRSCKELV